MDRCGTVGLPRFEDRTGKFRFVRRIGKMLCLQTKRGMFLVRMTKRLERTIQEIPRIELNARFGRVDPHCSAAGRFVDEGTKRHLLRSSLVENETVIVSASKVLFGDLVNPFANSVGSTEVQRRSGDRLQHPRRNERIACRQKAICMERQNMVVVGIRKTRKIPKRVIRQVHDRRFVRHGTVFHGPAVLVIKPVNYGNIEFAGIAFFAVL